MPIALGMERREMGLEEAQRRKDAEFGAQVGEFNASIANLQQKLSTMNPSSPEYQKTMLDLKSQIEARNGLFHPAKNPGALEKFGHLISRDVFRRPETPAPAVAPPTVSVQGPQTPGGLKAGAEAQLLAAGAPMSPEQTAANANAERLREQQQTWNSVLDWAQKHGISGDPLEELKSHILGVPIPKGTPVGKPYKGPDGNWYQPVRDQQTGQITDTPMPPGYHPPPSATMQQPVRAWGRDEKGIYSVLLDRATNKPEDETKNYDLLPPPYLVPRITQGSYQWTDPEGNLHSTPIERETTPVLPAVPGAQPSNSGRRARGGAGGSGGDRILGWKGTPTYTKAENTWVAMSGLADLFDKQATHRSPEGDTNLVLSLIRSEAGRVNQTEIAQMFQAGGISEAPERWAAKVHGKLPDDLYEQLRQFVHDLAGSAKDTMDSLKPKGPGDLKQKTNPDPLGIF